jgi:uncharacterized protein (DUF427 family)
MSLTVGRGPFGHDPAGRFNVEIDPPGALLFWDPVPYRVRALLGRETVLDSSRVMMLHETGRLPVWHFPEADLRGDLLEPSATVQSSPHKGDMRFRSVRVGERLAPDAVWFYVAPPPEASFLTGYVGLDWDSFNEWFVEDEQVFGHPRDPYSRIDVYKTTRHVRVLVDGEVIADSRRAKVLFETALPPRYYLPAEDVRTELLVPSPTRTRCAYKGSASYWHVDIGGHRHDDLVWTYPTPQHDAAPVRDLLAFFNERIDLEIDGQVPERPRTQWSHD